MKTLLFSLILILSFSFGAQGQCNPTFPTGNIVTGSYLSNQNFNGNHIFQGPMTISISVNWNNFDTISFSGEVNVYQNINLSSGGTVFTDGDVYLNYLNMPGNSNLYASGNQVQIFNMISNNSNPGVHNNIHLEQGTLLFYNGNQYFVGDTIQLSGNSSNRVYVLGCVSTPLNITFNEFFFRNGYLYWDVTSDNFKLHLQYASTNDPNIWTTQCTPSPLKGSVKASVGFYRLLVGSETSKVISVGWDQIPPSNKSLGPIVDFRTGRIIQQASAYQPYVQDGKKKEIIP